MAKDIRLPKEYNPERISQLLSGMLNKIEKMASDKKIGEATAIGSSPALGERELQIFDDAGTRKLFVRHNGKNYSVDLIEVT